MKLATAEQMRAIDQRAIEGCGVPGIVLMENAAIALREAALEMLRACGGHTVKILAGGGNNGGDGLALGRQLLSRNVEVECLLLSPASELAGDAATNLKAAQALGVPVRELGRAEAPAALGRDLCDADLVVDAILGTGITGEVRGAARRGIEALSHVPPERVLAVDVPSGVDSDTGQVLGAAVRCARTVTLGLAKVGLYCYPGAAYAGEVTVDPIGLPPELLEPDSIKVHLTTAGDCRAALPARRPDAHKGDCGRVLVVAGSAGLTGAAAMAGLAALRAGAGLVTVATPKTANAILEVKLTEVMTAPMAETGDGAFALTAVASLLEMCGDSDVVAIGPGVSQANEAQRVARRLVREVEPPIVVDADGLNALVGRVEVVQERRSPAVLTPHPGELSRLTEQSVDEIQADRVQAALKAAEAFGAIVVLKGARTVVAAPDGTAHVNPTGNEGMASGGTGDVLTGLIAGLIAQGAEPYEAAMAGVYVHGLAGDLAAASSTRAMVACDLMDQLAEAFAAVEG